MVGKLSGGGAVNQMETHIEEMHKTWFLPMLCDGIRAVSDPGYLSESNASRFDVFLHPELANL